MAKKKWKKRLKKIAKAALIGGALYAATKGLKGARSKAVSKAAASENANVGINTRPSLIDAQDAGTTFTRQPRVPDRISSPLRPSVPRKKVWTGNQTGHGPMFYTPKYKKGGSVTGIAKRGFGRALMKGKK